MLWSVSEYLCSVADIYGIPADVTTNALMNALVTFLSDLAQDSPLNVINIVDDNSATLKTVINGLTEVLGENEAQQGLFHTYLFIAYFNTWIMMKVSFKM